MSKRYRVRRDQCAGSTSVLETHPLQGHPTKWRRLVLPAVLERQKLVSEDTFGEKDLLDKVEKISSLRLEWCRTGTPGRLPDWDGSS